MILNSDENKLLVIVANSILKSVLNSNKELISTKSDSTRHGYGIKTIRSIANKYNGIAKFYEESNLFYCQVLMYDLEEAILAKAGEYTYYSESPSFIQDTNIINGKYVSPYGAPYEQRALPYVQNNNAYHVYYVNEDIYVTSSEISPAFNYPGGGIQYELPITVAKMVEQGILTEVK